jgi:predicted transcriptional regulator
MPVNANKTSSGIMDIVSPDTVNIVSLTEKQMFALKVFTHEKAISKQTAATACGLKVGAMTNHITALISAGHVEKYNGKYRRTKSSSSWAKLHIDRLRAKQNETTSDGC